MAGTLRMGRELPGSFIVRRHRLAIGIGGVGDPRPWIGFHVILLDLPIGVLILFLQDVGHFSVSLPQVESTCTTANHSQERQDAKEADTSKSEHRSVSSLKRVPL